MTKGAPASGDVSAARDASAKPRAKSRHLIDDKKVSRQYSIPSKVNKPK